MAQSDREAAKKPVFYLQSEHKIELSADGKADWMRVAGGISSVEPDGNEEVSQDAYLDGTESDVTGGQIVLTLSGHRLVGDKAQDFVADKMFVYGDARRCYCRWTLPGNAKQFTFPCTLANIKGPSGEANEKGEFEFEIHANQALKANAQIAQVTPTNKEASV